MGKQKRAEEGLGEEESVAAEHHIDDDVNTSARKKQRNDDEHGQTREAAAAAASPKPSDPALARVRALAEEKLPAIPSPRLSRSARKSVLSRGRRSSRRSITGIKFDPSCLTEFHADIPAEASAKSRFAELARAALMYGVRDVASVEKAEGGGGGSNQGEQCVEDFLKKFDVAACLEKTAASVAASANPQNARMRHLIGKYREVEERLRGEIAEFKERQSELQARSECSGCGDSDGNAAAAADVAATTPAATPAATGAAAGTDTDGLPGFLSEKQRSFLRQGVLLRSANVRSELAATRDTVTLQVESLFRTVKRLRRAHDVEEDFCTAENGRLCSEAFATYEHVDSPQRLIKGFLLP